MNNLPNGWQVKYLGEVVRISKGKKLNSLVNSKTPSSKRFIQIDDLRNNEQLKYTEDNSGVLVNERDVLIAWDGANAGTIGFGLEGFIGSTIARLELIDEKISTNYLGWLLRTKSKYLRDNCTGATIPHINKSILESLNIPLPPLPIQKQIAEILEKADQARQKRKEANKLTDEFLKSVFIEMFGDPVKNPKRWETKLVNEISKVGTGGTPSREKPEYFTGNIPWVKTTEVTNDKIFDTEEKITKNALEESNCVIFPRGTVIIALYGQGLTRGRTSILEIEACTNQACGAILPSEKINSIFLWKQLLHFYHHLRSISRGGNQPNLNLSFVKNLRIIFPPISLQQQFAEIVNKTEALKEKQKQSEQELENLFQSLMQRAFRGELVS